MKQGVAGFKAFIRECLAGVRERKEEIDSLNVFPVPDGDTGTNLTLTLESTAESLEGAAAEEPGEVARAVIQGSLLGARGNSGVILSQILRGLAEAFASRGVLDSLWLSQGLERARELAYRAVLKPVEGTILTVLREAAEAARDVADSDPGRAARAALEAARRALASTPQLLPVLRQAGVVDAGGFGLVVVLERLARLFGGDPGRTEVPRGFASLGARTSVGVREAGSLEYKFEVEYLLEADEAGELAGALGGLGDSVAVVGSPGLFHVHVHTNRVFEVVEEGRKRGRVRDLKITYFEDQMAPSELSHEVLTGAACYVLGEGLRLLFRSLGVGSFVSPSQALNPSAGEILQSLERAPGKGVLFLPNHRDLLPAARQAVGLSSRPALLVPTYDPIQGLSAMVAYDPGSPLEVNAAAMEEAASRVVALALARASRAVVTPAGRAGVGEWVGLVRGEVVRVGGSAPELACELVAANIEPRHELLTLIWGAEASLEEAEALEVRLREAFPHLELESHWGGQPFLPYLLGLE